MISVTEAWRRHWIVLRGKTGLAKLQFLVRTKERQNLKQISLWVFICYSPTLHQLNLDFYATRTLFLAHKIQSRLNTAKRNKYLSVSMAKWESLKQTYNFITGTIRQCIRKCRVMSSTSCQLLMAYFNYFLTKTIEVLEEMSPIFLFCFILLMCMF